MKNIGLIIALVFSFAGIFVLSDFLERNQPQLAPEIAEADLFYKAETLKKYSASFDGLLADYYWMNALQYIGRKIVQKNGLAGVQIDNLKPLNPRLLYPMLDAATTLDPEFTHVYSYGAIVLPAVDQEQAVRIAHKGIAAQPDNWRLYHQLGYIHWKNKEFQQAAEIYAAGASKPGAPEWMRGMSATMAANGGSRETAREIYLQMYDSADDEQIKKLAYNRLLEVESFYETDVIDRAPEEFKIKNNRCANDWREIFPLIANARTEKNKPLRFAPNRAPLDPSDTPYLLADENGECSAGIDRVDSPVPPRLKN